jgi:hypothetical protein
MQLVSGGEKAPRFLALFFVFIRNYIYLMLTWDALCQHTDIATGIFYQTLYYLIGGLQWIFTP